MSSLSTRFAPVLTESFVFVSVAIVMICLLPLLAVTAFALRPVLLIVALAGLIVALCCPALPDARRRRAAGRL